MASTCIHKDNLGKILKYLHPNIVSNIDRYKERHYYLFPPYHGCRYRHRNRTRKRIQYNKREQCINPVQIFLWRPAKQKYLGNLIRLYMTRYWKFFFKRTSTNIFLTNLLQYSWAIKIIFILFTFKRFWGRKYWIKNIGVMFRKVW